MKVPKREITDDLIRVGDFIYPVDFIVLETQLVANSRAQTPVILGRPFLATANAIINCRNGSMRFTFGDITKEVNVFNLGKQPKDLEDQTFKVNYIENLTSEHKELNINLSWKILIRMKSLILPSNRHQTLLCQTLKPNLQIPLVSPSLP